MSPTHPFHFSFQGKEYLQTLPEPLPSNPAARARLLQIFVGRAAALGPGKVSSAFVKYATRGPVKIGVTGLAGDEQADLRVHGGPDMAVYAYPSEHYAVWSYEFPEHAYLWGAGCLGENLALRGWCESDVCVGDIVSLGSALLQVTRPRKPCFKLALRFNDLRLPRRLVESGRCGWYYRVLQPGSIAPDDKAELLHRPHPHWSIRRVNDISIASAARLDELEELAALPALADNWRSQVRSMAGSIEAVKRTSAFRPFRIVAIHDESRTIKSFQMAPDDGGGMAAAMPGQYVVIRTPSTASIQQRLRSYSLSSVVNAQFLQISVKREKPAGASSWLHENLRVGDCIDVLGPRGNFTLDQSNDKPLVLISAGVGITPMMSMLQAATTNNGGKIVPRQVLFIHGARNSGEQAFAAQIRDVAARHPAVKLHCRFSKPDPSDRFKRNHDSVGRIDREMIGALLTPLGECNVYLCGPPELMADVVKWIGELDLKARVRTESFNGAAERDRVDGPESSRVSFAKAKSSVVWKRGGPSMLELAEAKGLAVRSECRTGLCGSCATRIISGQAGYDLEPVATIARGEMLLCCGHPLGEQLVLDL